MLIRVLSLKLGIAYKTRILTRLSTTPTSTKLKKIMALRRRMRSLKLLKNLRAKMQVPRRRTSSLPVDFTVRTLSYLKIWTKVSIQKAMSVQPSLKPNGFTRDGTRSSAQNSSQT